MGWPKRSVGTVNADDIRAEIGEEKASVGETENGVYPMKGTGARPASSTTFNPLRGGSDRMVKHCGGAQSHV